MLARLLLLLCLLAASPAVAERVRVAIFDFEIIDTSLDGEMKGTSPEEKARLAKLAPALRAKLAASDRYLVVDTEPVTERARAQNLQACGGCDATLAHEAGADVAVTGTVQKVSNLILNLNIYLRDAKDDRLLQSMSADFRGNTGESWSRALSYLIRNKLLVEPDEKIECGNHEAPAAARKSVTPPRRGGLGGLVLLLHVGG